MPRLLPPLLAAFCAACALDPPPSDPPPSAPHPAAVRVATWNVHDLFDSEDRLVPPGELDAVLGPADLDAKLDRLAAVLARLDADLIVLQEVENRRVLEALAARAGYPEARLVEGADPRGIDVAALSRLPVLAYVSHRGDRDAAGRPLWPRDCVEVHADLGGGRRLVVVASHLSSALSDDGTRRREQSARMREIADAAAGRGAALVVAGGDLNDEAGGAALEPLLGDGAWLAPHAALPAAEGWTWAGAGRRLALDHLAVRREDAAAVLAAGVLGGADVEDASDHRPVLLDVRPEGAGFRAADAVPRLERRR